MDRASTVFGGSVGRGIISLLLALFVVNIIVSFWSLEPRTMNTTDKELAAIRVQIAEEKQLRLEHERASAASHKEQEGSVSTKRPSSRLSAFDLHLMSMQSDILSRRIGKTAESLLNEFNRLAAAVEDVKSAVRKLGGSLRDDAPPNRVTSSPAVAPPRGVGFSPEKFKAFLMRTSELLTEYAKTPWLAVAPLLELEQNFADDVMRAVNASLPVDLVELQHTLAASIQLRLHHFQQLPASSCSDAPRLFCSIDKGCGFGCQFHHVADCLITAHALGRTFILDDSRWSYDRSPDDPAPHTAERGWKYHFRPITTCPFTSMNEMSNYRDSAHRNDLSVKQVSLTIIDARSDARWAVYYVPSHFRPLIKTFHRDAPLWYLGQIEKYLLRLNAEDLEFVRSVRDRLGYRHPIVGLHIRRTDKIGTEARFHSAEEYLKKAKVFWESRLTSNYTTPVHDPSTWTPMEQERRRIDKLVGFDWEWYDCVGLLCLFVPLSPSRHQPLRSPATSAPHPDRHSYYLVTDDNKECAKMSAALPDTVVICNQEAANSGAVENRNSRLSLLWLLADIFHLAEADYLVGTFSSQVSRVAYELMQDDYRPNYVATGRAASLDDGWYYSG